MVDILDLNKEREKDNYIHCSELGSCKRKSFFRIKERTPFITEEAIRRMQFGTELHKNLICSLDDRNYLKEFTMKDEELNLSGTFDLYEIEWRRIIDLKFTKSINEKFLEKYKYQLHGYYYLAKKFDLQVDSLMLKFFEYSGKTKIYEFVPEDHYIDNIKKYCADVNKAVESNEPPEPSEDYSECKFCRYKDFCNHEPVKKEEKEEVIVLKEDDNDIEKLKELDKVLKRMEEINKELKPLEKKYKNIRNYFSKKKQPGKYQYNDININIISFLTKDIDRSKLKEDHYIEKLVNRIYVTRGGKNV